MKNYHLTAEKCKSYRYMNSFVPDAIASWNLLMDIFNYKVVPSLGIRKNDIISLIRPESKFSSKFMILQDFDIFFN